MTSDPHIPAPSTAPWKIILVSLLAMVVIFNKTSSILEQIDEDKNFSISEDIDRDVEKEKNENKDEPPLTSEDLFPALSKIQEASHSDLISFQKRLEDNRGAINKELILPKVMQRAEWANTTAKYMHWAVLGVLLLLLLPLFYWRSLPADSNRNRRLFETMPIYLLTTAATLFIVHFLTNAALAVQGIQLIVATLSSPPIAFTDGLIQYLVYQISVHDLQDLWNFFALRQPSFEDDPMAAIGALHHLAEGIRQAYDSDLLRLGFNVIKRCTWLVDLIGPVFAVATSILVYGAVLPVLKQSTAYPKQVQEGKADGRLWPFVKVQLWFAWRELRATLWVVFLMLIISLFAVVAVRVLVYPLVIVFIQSLLATEAHLRGGGDLPDIGIFLTLCSMGVYLVVSIATCFGGAGIAIGKSYLMFRHRAHNKGAFRDYPDFKWVFRTALLKVAGVAIILGGLVGLTYWGVGMLNPAPILRLWSGPILFGPVYLALLWWTRVPHNMLATKQRKVIHSPILSSLGPMTAEENVESTPE